MADTQSAGHTQSGLYTCVTCHVAFKDPENQRAHFQTEWHAYNLKRKVAAMKPVTKAEFEAKVEAQEEKSKAEEAKAAFTSTCQVCNKHYSSENAYSNHLLSKKHKENELKAPAKKDKPAKEKPAQEEPEDEAMDDEELTEDQLIEKKIANSRRLTPEECIFCSHFSETLEENVHHMAVTHSFFIPDIEYLVDLEGLIQYLGEKVSIGNVCLYCNGKGKGFNTLEAVRKHMTDKGHCKLDYDGDADLEYSDYYDFRPSYPDYQEGQEAKEGDDDEIVDTDARAPIIAPDDSELVLPNGKVLGHRSLNRYYKQKFKPEDTRTSVAVSKLMSQYRALGWNMAPKERSHEQIEQLRDRQSYLMTIGVQANKLQRHFRRQVDY